VEPSPEGVRKMKVIQRSLSILSILGTSTLLAALNHATVYADENPIKQVAATKPVEAEDGKRVVAYIHGNMALTREQFGEYLIQRVGKERIELFVNKFIIEHACKEKNIEVTSIEIDAVLDEDCKVMGINRNDFLNQVLKQYSKTLFEWKEDVIKPRIMLQKLLREQIKVDEEDLKKMYENRYGQKVQAKIIIWPKGQEKFAAKVYDDLRKSDEDFDRHARKQADPNLAAREGAIPPIARFGGPDDTLEKEAFKLKVGEVSRLIDTPFGVIVIKCVGTVEANTKVLFDSVKAELTKEVVDRKVSAEIPKLMEQFKREANPVYILQPANQKTSDMKREVENELEVDKKLPPKSKLDK
jgi:hypothetical protein